MTERPHPFFARLRAPLTTAGAVFAVWLALQALVFRSGLYWDLARPDSNIGSVSHVLYLLDAAYRPGMRTVLVLGDSRIGEGFSGPRASEGGDIHFINLSVPGSTPRTWYYLLREIDRRGVDYEAIVVGTLYVPTDQRRSADWPLDRLHQLPLLGLRDLRDYPDWRPILLPELVAQDDLRALIAHPLQRRKDLRNRAIYADDTIHYSGRGERLPDDFELAPPPPIPAPLARENAAWQYRWLSRLRERAHARGAVFLAFALPRGPRAAVLPPARLPDWPGIDVLPADVFADLESPAFFFDVLHLNAAGRERLSVRLGEHVRARLAQDAR